MDDAARTLDRGPVSTPIRVHAPMIWASLVTAGLVVCVDVIKELPATLVMRPFASDTLAVLAYCLAANERLTGAATAALAIVAVGILPVILPSKTIARSRPGEWRAGNLEARGRLPRVDTASVGVCVYVCDSLGLRPSRNASGL